MHLHIGYLGHVDLWLHGLVAEGSIQHQQDGAQSVTEINLSLAITGAMKMTHAAAMEVLLRLPPLHVMIEVEGQTEVYRLMCTQQWKLKSTNCGHAKQSWNIEHEPILQTWTDRVIPRYAYYMLFMVKFPDKCEWQDMFKPDTNGAWSGT